MKSHKLLPIDQFCKHYEIDFSIVSALGENGVIEIIMGEESTYLHQVHYRQFLRVDSILDSG